MKEEMINLYKELNINNQRNEFSSLLMKMDKLLDELLEKNNIPKINEVKNYILSDSENMTESDTLAFFYEDLWDLKNKILILLMANSKKDNNYE